MGHQEGDSRRHHKASSQTYGNTEGNSESHDARSSKANKERDSGSQEIQRARKMLDDNASHIEWDGIKFVPKSMDLNRINLGRIRSSQIFNDLRTSATHVMTRIYFPINVLPTGINSFHYN